MPGWNFDHSYITLPESLFSHVKLEKVAQPELVLYNQRLDAELGLHFADKKNEILADVFSGQLIPADAHPIAQAYAGHQFGYFNMLGDGRAILLGEHIAPNGKRYDIQFKGSGLTPYSRRGDGKATLSAMLREYLFSEAMHALGIRTTRSLAVVKTGEQVIRQDIHDGAVLTRIASSHIRVGTFEYAARLDGKETLQALFNYTIERHFSHLKGKDDLALALLNEVMHHQISLIVEWMRVGFIHGVMNTDNMSIAGETIDYGPCAFMNTYHPDTVFSSIDTQGRYAYGNQPYIAQWNLSCLAGALLKLVDEDQNVAIEKVKAILNDFPRLYNNAWYRIMGRKIGIEVMDESVMKLVDELLEWMKLTKADYTTTFLYLMETPLPKQAVSIYEEEKFRIWQKEWQEKVAVSGGLHHAQSIMRNLNPVYIARNYLVEAALDAAVYENNYRLFQSMIERLSTPYSFEEGYDEFFLLPERFDHNYKTFCGT